jgi:hypothetical protein
MVVALKPEFREGITETILDGRVEAGRRRCRSNRPTGKHPTREAQIVTIPLDFRSDKANLCSKRGNSEGRGVALLPSPYTTPSMRARGRRKELQDCPPARACKMQRVAHQVCSSEIQPQRKHKLPLQCGPVKCCVDNYPAGLTIHAGEDRLVEVNFVENVEDFGAKLQGNILP